MHTFKTLTIKLHVPPTSLTVRLFPIEVVEVFILRLMQSPMLRKDWAAGAARQHTKKARQSYIYTTAQYF